MADICLSGTYLSGTRAYDCSAAALEYQYAGKRSAPRTAGPPAQAPLAAAGARRPGRCGRRAGGGVRAGFRATVHGCRAARRAHVGSSLWLYTPPYGHTILPWTPPLAAPVWLPASWPRMQDFTCPRAIWQL